MGCWNQTCSLTNLPITCGDSIVLIPLVQNHDFALPGLTYYANDNYEIFGMPIFGRYDDYGGITDIVTCQTSINFLKETEMFLRNYDKYSDIDVNERVPFDENNLEKFLNDYICEEMLYIKNNTTYDSTERNLNMMMIHRELYHKLIAEIGSLIPYKQTKTLREFWRERIVNTLNIVKEKQKEWEEYDDLTFFNKHVLPKEFQKCCYIDLCTVDVTYQYMMKSLYNEFDEGILEEFIDMLLFKYVLTRLRKGYLATSGAGSQAEDYYFHKIVSEWTLDFINQKYEEKKSYLDLNEPDYEQSVLADTVWWRD